VTAGNETAGRDVRGRAGQKTDERRKRSTAASPSTQEVAERLWPPPDPVNYAKREAVARLDKSDCAIRKALELREAADAVLFDDLSRLWIHPTRVEILLGSELAQLRAAASGVQDALDLLASARSENERRFYDERIRERQDGNL